ncbi:unnamed protein product [Caenorhabditis nigoni]
MAQIKQLWLMFSIITTLIMLMFLIGGSNISQGFSSSYSFSGGDVDPRATRRFKNLIVHIDLKGAPPRVEYLIDFFKLLSKNHVDGVVMEYEDMFPYSGDLEDVRRDSGAYSEDDIRRITMEAAALNLEIIPLIQTFGHLEFLLKRPAFRTLSEDFIDINTICISDDRSIDIIHQMILQIRRLHPNSTRIHIGSDEAYHVAEDVRCHQKMSNEKIGKSELKMRHIAKIGKFAKEIAHFETVFAWNDMFDKEAESAIKGAELHKWIVPVVWGYRVDVTEDGYFPEGLFERIPNVFEEFYVASAYKGADGARQQFSNISRYLENQKSYTKLMDLHPKAAEKVSGIFVTGWSRFNHLNALCELLPVSIPSLIIDLLYLNYGISGNSAWKSMKNRLECDQETFLRGVLSEWTIRGCKFPGAEVFEIIMHDWKRQVDRRLLGRQDLSPDQKSPTEVLSNLKTALKPILFDADIDEIYHQYLNDFHSIHSRTTIFPDLSNS